MEKGDKMKNVTTIATATKQMFHEIGVRGATLVMAAMMFLLLVGMTLPAIVFNHGAQAAQGAGIGTHHMIAPSDIVPTGKEPHKMLVNEPTVDLRYTSSAEKSMPEPRRHRNHRRGAAAASSSAASSNRRGGAAASSSAAASGDGAAAASSSAAAA